jgi:putative Mn2+ efflux pump MntP
LDSPAKVFASVLGLTAFVVAIVTGLATGPDASATLTRAIVSMVVCYPLGLLLGLLAGHAVDEHIREYRAAHPVIALDAYTKPAPGGAVDA